MIGWGGIKVIRAGLRQKIRDHDWVGGTLRWIRPVNDRVGEQVDKG